MSKSGKLNAAFLVASIALTGAAAFPYRDAEGAKATVEKTTTLHDVTIKDERSLFGCGKGDLYRTKFSAVNDKGQKVDGIVCKGIFKGSTVRYE
jgi:hypothetical protein